MNLLKFAERIHHSHTERGQFTRLGENGVLHLFNIKDCSYKLKQALEQAGETRVLHASNRKIQILIFFVDNSHEITAMVLSKITSKDKNNFKAIHQQLGTGYDT